MSMICSMFAPEIDPLWRACVFSINGRQKKPPIRDTKLLNASSSNQKPWGLEDYWEKKTISSEMRRSGGACVVENGGIGVAG